MYPLTGNVAAHVGGVQASLLASQRLLYRLHRAGLAWGTVGSGALCGRYPMPVMQKSQYRWQMTQPVPAVDPFTGCNPTGAPRCSGRRCASCRSRARTSGSCCGEKGTAVSYEPIDKPR